MAAPAHSRKNQRGKGKGDRPERPPPMTHTPKELAKQGQWSASITFDFPVSIKDIYFLWKNLQMEVAGNIIIT